MYKKILVPIIFDEAYDTQASFTAAQALADEGAAFTVLHVMEAIPAYVTAEVSKDMLEQTRVTVQAALDEEARALPGAQTALSKAMPGRPS
jgi:nucleotide-binding universal stress UspA family protein